MARKTGKSTKKRRRPDIGLQADAATDTGLVRAHNEDSFLVDRDLRFFVVSDGMGGHRAGAKASGIVVDVLARVVSEQLAARRGSRVDFSRVLDDAVRAASGQVRATADKYPEYKGMGATVVACLIRRGLAWLVHMGDSRAYRLRENTFELLTLDHSITTLLVGLGLITKEQSSVHPARNTISRYVGMGSEFGPELQAEELKAGDRLLLCSDGLTNMVGESRIGRVLWEEEEPAAACARLVQLANDAGGRDNITALAVHYGKASPAKRKKQRIRVKRPARKRSRESLWRFIEDRV